MTNGDVCSVVNALFRAVCDLKLNTDKNILKDQFTFNSDFTRNRRAIINSFVLYEYYSSDNLSITQDQLDLMREFIITYIGKYEDKNILDTLIYFSNNTLKFAFFSFERASKTNNTSDIIKEIEMDIARAYENSIFKIIDQITASLPQDETIVTIRNLQKYFRTGNLISKYNENNLGNYSELQKYILNTSAPSIIPKTFNPFNPVDCKIGPSPFEPYAPYEPSQPYEPSDFLTFDYISKKIGNISSLNDDIPNLNEANIKAAIGKILEISTTEELTQA